MRIKDTENSERKKQAILKAATSCFANKGFHQTSMRDIAQEAAMSLGGIYRHFASKNAIILSFIEQSNQESAEAFDNLANAKDIKKAMHHLLKLIWEALVANNELGLYMEISSEALRNKEVYQILQQENSEGQLTRILLYAQENQKITLLLSPEMTSMTITAALEKAAYNYLLDSSFSKKDAMNYIKHVVKTLIT